MADKIRVNTMSLEKDTTSIQTHLKQVNKKIEKMQEDVKGMNAMWSGEANKAFNKAFQDDIKAIRTLCESIDGIIQYETTAKKEYNKCERTVKDAIDSMSV